MVKKKVTPKKPVRKRAAPTKETRVRGDRSRIDTKPLQEHIRNRIQELKKGGGQALTAARTGESPDDTIARLQSALDTLMDICHPSMDIPI